LQTLRPYYQKATGRNFSIESLTGRGGAQAWAELTRRTPDGYALALVVFPSFILRSLSTYPPYKLTELAVVCLFAELPVMLWVPENSPYRTVEALVESARVYPERVVIAGPGTSSGMHLVHLRFNRLSGVKALYFPFLETVSSMHAASSGQAHAVWGYALPQPGMRPLAVALEQRHPLFPDVPTFDERKIGLFESAAFGLALPVDTPAKTSQAVSAAFFNIARSSAFQEDLEALGFSPKPMNLLDTGQFLEAQTEEYRSLREEYGLE
jgi:tripartite-type tricarboxylate transporter receptor subunit TctC